MSGKFSLQFMEQLHFQRSIVLLGVCDSYFQIIEQNRQS